MSIFKDSSIKQGAKASAMSKGALTFWQTFFLNCRVLKAGVVLLSFLFPVSAVAGTATVDGVYYTTYSTYAVAGGLAASTNPLVIASNVNGLPVTEIAKDAFEEEWDFSSAMLPDSIVTIRESAFAATGILTIDLGAGVKTIEKYAFEDCQYLTSITIPNSVTSIGTGAFDNCESLKTVSLPYKCSINDAYIFDDCNAIKSIYIRGGKPNYTLNFDGMGVKPTIYLDVREVSSLWGCLAVYNEPAVLNSLIISGSSSVSSGDSSAYVATAKYTNGTENVVTPVWSITSGAQYATITDAGLLTVANLPEPVTIELLAVYSDAGVQKTATFSVEAKPVVFQDSVFEYTYVFNPGWQMVSIVLNLTEESKQELLALAPFTFDQRSRSYSCSNDLTGGMSCFFFVQEKTSVTVRGTPLGTLIPSR